MLANMDKTKVVDIIAKPVDEKNKRNEKRLNRLEGITTQLLYRYTVQLNKGLYPGGQRPFIIRHGCILYNFS